MKEKDDIQFANIMAALAAAYQKEISSETVDVFRKFLADIEIKDLEKAVVEIVMTRSDNRFPTVADIRKKVFRWEDEKLDDEALEQWGFLLKHSPHEVVFEGGEAVSFQINKFEGEHFAGQRIPIYESTNMAVKMAFGSWSDFRKLDTKNETWDRFHFIKCYKAIARVKQRKRLLTGHKIKLLKE